METKYQTQFLTNDLIYYLILVLFTLIVLSKLLAASTLISPNANTLCSLCTEGVRSIKVCGTNFDGKFLAEALTFVVMRSTARNYEQN